jgi:hypothetical protein
MTEASLSFAGNLPDTPRSGASSHVTSDSVQAW